MNDTLLSRRVLRGLLVAWILLLGRLPLGAAQAPMQVPLREYVHTAWTHHDGVPLTQITGLLQTADGYLWLFTRDALLRFDGMRFVAESTPCVEPITSQTRAIDGGFWAVCGDTLIRRTPDARIVVVSKDVSFHRQHTLLADRNGRLWILGKTIRYLESNGTGGRVLDSPESVQFFLGAQDSDGVVWAMDGRYVFKVEDDRVEQVYSPRGARCPIPSRSHGVLVSAGPADATTVWHFRKDAPPRLVMNLQDAELSTVPRTCMQEAEDGGLWFTAQRNLVILAAGGRVETLPDTGLWQRAVYHLLIDRDGSIWGGGTSGLHRLRKPTARLMQGPRVQQATFVFIDSRRQLWTGSSDQLRRRHLESDGENALIDTGLFMAIGEDERGDVWVSKDRKAIGRMRDGRFVEVPDASGKPITNVNAFVRDRQGHLFALSRGVGLYRVTPGPPRLEIASTRASDRVIMSPQSGTWISVEGGGLEQHVDGRTHQFPGPVPASPLLPPHLAQTLLEDGTSIWMGSLAGLHRLRNGTWTTWTKAHGLSGDGSVKAIMPDRSGQLWMMTGGGLIRAPRAQFDATPDGAPRPLSFARIGALDGVVAHYGNHRSSPNAFADGSGRLYFTTVDSVATVDPDAVTDSSMVPPIAIESVLVDNAAVDPRTSPRFIEPSRLQFEYTTLDLRNPEYARFRYQLQGYDASWIEAGTQRKVTYGTLPPGAYQFRVVGAGSEGIWNNTGDVFAFEIVPVFYHTWWFRLLVLAAITATFVAMHRLRVRVVTQQMRVRFDERLAERTRIARDLHDTLLQGTLAASFHAQLAKMALTEVPASPEVDIVRRPLDQAVELLAQVVDEGRATVSGLRSAPTAETLPDLLQQAAADQPNHAAIDFRVTVDGEVRTLQPQIAEETLGIAREAVINAYKHSVARRIDVELRYAHDTFQCVVKDDGRGIEARAIEQGEEGHWGLTGMRERAERVGATLSLRSRVGSGTEISLLVPARHAYQSSDKRPA